MRETCLSLWPTDACEWSVVDIWRWADLLQKAMYISLVLMLFYTFFVVIRFVRYYVPVRREFRGNRLGSESSRVRNLKRVVADLSRGLGTLRAIGICAPFLALAGTSYGIVAVFSRGVSGSRASALAYIWDALPTPLVSTASGILVALPAVLFHNFLCMVVEHFAAKHSVRNFSTDSDLGSFQFAQTLPLTKRFARLPPLAVLGVFSLTLAFVVYLGFGPYPLSTGLRISGALERCESGIVDRTVVLRIMAGRQLFLNFEPSDWRGVQARLRDIYAMRRDRVLYLQAADELPVQTVADAIDLLRNIATESGPLGLSVRLIAPRTAVESTLCREPVRAQSPKFAEKDRARENENRRR
jgi:hypothetical protein